jgi:hypothetical protein
MEELDLNGDLTYSKMPVKILDTAERVTHNKIIRMCKVQWSHHTEDESHLGAWRRPQIRLSQFISECFLNLVGEIPLRGVGL